MSQTNTDRPNTDRAKTRQTKSGRTKSGPMKTGQTKAGRLRVMQTGSVIGCTERQRATLIGLGLNRLNRVRDLEDTPAIRGMIKKVGHLVRVERAN